MRPLTLDVLNPQLQQVQYAVRGELAIKAELYRDQLKQGGHNLPFDKVISSNIGNPQQKGHDPPAITFNQAEWPALADLAPGVFPADFVARAKELSGYRCRRYYDEGSVDHGRKGGNGAPATTTARLTSQLPAISDGVTGNGVGGGAGECGAVGTKPLTTVDARPHVNLGTMREMVESAETDEFDPYIAAASGDCCSRPSNQQDQEQGAQAHGRGAAEQDQNRVAGRRRRRGHGYVESWRPSSECCAFYSAVSFSRCSFPAPCTRRWTRYPSVRAPLSPPSLFRSPPSYRTCAPP
ncbi:hypothetical protein C8R44DRAFT_859508 [Mycena epipterygia]|nr:hypothetical protein C8R44DRAFT_859508 [Mycena epipterygia]